MGVQYTERCYLPELEFTHYLPTSVWTSLAKNSKACVVVSGSPLASIVFYLMKRKYVGWFATPYKDDRADRKRFSFVRKLIDSVLIEPISCKLEKILIRWPITFSLSQYTRSDSEN